LWLWRRKPRCDGLLNIRKVERGNDRRYEIELQYRLWRRQLSDLRVLDGKNSLYEEQKSFATQVCTLLFGKWSDLTEINVRCWR
jgi:hypothetical protein